MTGAGSRHTERETERKRGSEIGVAPCRQTLEQAHLDWLNVRVEMAVGALVVLAVCFACYAATLKCGLLLDDFNHVEYVHRALKGDWHDFLLNFYSNWGKLDVMRSYRPMISVTFLTDYLCYGLNYVGYHVTNVLMLFIASLFVGLITLELTGCFGNRDRAAPAIWAALLFAVYPLHAESVSWVVGRVDLVCADFYFASLFAFLRYRLTRRKSLATLSIVLFLLALGSKEMAVTLPVVCLLASLLLPARDDSASPGERRKLLREELFVSLALFVALFACAVLRTAMLGATIGGYGPSGINLLIASFGNFLNLPSLLKIFVPLNDELRLKSHIALFLSIEYALLAAAWVAALLSSRRRSFIGVPSLYLFLFGWAAIAVAPTFQIWRIFPNLVGSRLFFISSAPFCIALALGAGGCAFAAKRRAAVAGTVIGAVSLLLLFLSWVWILEQDLRPWCVAGREMQTIESRLKQFTVDLPPGKKVLLLNLPQDYKGAGLLTRSQYLEQIARPPFVERAFADKLATVEPIIFGSHDYIWPGELRTALSDPSVASAYAWSESQADFVPFHRAAGAGALTLSPPFSIAAAYPAGLHQEDGGQWHEISLSRPNLERHDRFLRVLPYRESRRDRSAILWFKVPPLDPLEANFAQVSVQVKSAEQWLDESDVVKKVTFVWRSGSGQSDSPTAEARLVHGTGDGQGAFHVWLGRYRSFSLAGAPLMVGLKFKSGAYAADLYSITISSDRSRKPAIAVDGNSCRPGTAVLIRSDSLRPGSDSHFLSFDASNVQGASQVQIITSQRDLTFDANVEGELESGPRANRLRSVSRQKLSGTIALSAFKLGEGTHQIVAVALDKSGKPTGLPSEPVSLTLSTR